MTRLTRPRRLTGPILVTVLGLVCGCTASPEESGEPPTSATPTKERPTVDVATVDLGEYARDLYELTNDVRADEGHRSLEYSDCAEQQAAARAEDLVGTEELEHAPMHGVLEECSASFSAENLVRSVAEPPAVIDAWMNSSGHRENLMSEDATRLGVACTLDDDQILCSQIYLGPADE
ncbi:hypothetical protein GCM10023169_01680 [Georgenia halophila]|uniref:SCP domain-containing protein n=1 Tax=Georgenia halophila TaxID=620889 RepID=A0ABP8KTS3_9MICO